jgi:hypothetical protein
MKKPNDPTEASIKATKDWYSSLTKQQQQLVFLDTKTYANQHAILFPQKKVEDTKVTPTSTKTTASTKTTTINKPSTVNKVMAGTALVGDALNLFPPTSLLGYGIGLVPTTYDVVNSFKKGNYKEAATDALGYIPALKYIKKGINLKKGLDNLNSFHKFNTGIQMINTIKDVKDAKEEFAYGGSTNRFMQPSQYYEPTQGFKLDYNQLAAGVLAREDAYDQNAAQIDAMDQDYIQGITGIESDKAKEINSNISTMVNTIGDQYNGDLSKAGDAVRNAKKYIKQTTGFDSEGALINANLKAYNKDIKDIDKKKDWSLERKNQAKQDALTKHNKLTGESRTNSGNFSTYSNRGMEAYFDIQALTMEAVKNITPETYQKAWGAKWTGKKDADGNYEFLESGTQKTIKKTPQEILSLVPDVLQNNPQAMAYMKEDAYLGTMGIPQEYYDELELEQDLKKEKLSEVQNMGSTKELQQLLIDEGYLAEGQADGNQGPITNKALLNYTDTLNKTFDQEWAQNEYMNSKVAGLGNQGVKQYAQNDVINTINYTQGIAYADGIKAAKEKADAAKIAIGIAEVKAKTINGAELIENIQNLEAGVKQQKGAVSSLLESMGFPRHNLTKSIREYENMPWKERGAMFCPTCASEEELNGNLDYQNANKLLTSYKYQANQLNRLNEYIVESVDFDNFDFDYEFDNTGVNITFFDDALLKKTARSYLAAGLSDEEFADKMMESKPNNEWNNVKAKSVGREQLLFAFDALKRKLKEAQPDYLNTDVLAQERGMVFTGNAQLDSQGNSIDKVITDYLSFTLLKDDGSTSSIGKIKSENDFVLDVTKPFKSVKPVNGVPRWVVYGTIGTGDNKEATSFGVSSEEAAEYMKEQYMYAIKSTSNAKKEKETAANFLFGLSNTNYDKNIETSNLLKIGKSEFTFNNAPMVIVKVSNKYGTNVPDRYLLQKDGITQLNTDGTTAFDNLEQIETFLGFQEYNNKQ